MLYEVITYKMQRIFTIDKISKKNPLKCVPYIIKWTKKNSFRVIFEWTIIGLTLPKELLEEREKFNKIIDEAKEIDITEEMLLGSIPDSIPYRTVKQIEELIV